MTLRQRLWFWPPSARPALLGAALLAVGCQQPAASAPAGEAKRAATPGASAVVGEPSGPVAPGADRALPHATFRPVAVASTPVAGASGAVAGASTPVAGASAVASSPVAVGSATLVPALSGVVPGSSAALAASGVPPALFDPSGAPLPQTTERPTLTSPHFRALGAALWHAIVTDAPDAALPFFFPVVAYEQVKAIEKPARDWETRLVRLFRRDIHEYHLGLGQARDQLRFEALEVAEERAKLMKPHTEGNRLPYWRVTRSQLVYRDPRDRVRRLEVTSLISWRGEWYLVHLHGFQ